MSHWLLIFSLSFSGHTSTAIRRPEPSHVECLAGAEKVIDAMAVLNRKITVNWQCLNTYDAS